MVEHLRRLPQPLRHPEDGGGSGEQERLPDETPIDKIEMTVRASNYLRKKGCKTLGDIRQKITRATLLMDGHKVGSQLFEDIVELFESTGSKFRDAHSDNLDWGKE